MCVYVGKQHIQYGVKDRCVCLSHCAYASRIGRQSQLLRNTRRSTYIIYTCAIIQMCMAVCIIYSTRMYLYTCINHEVRYYGLLRKFVTECLCTICTYHSRRAWGQVIDARLTLGYISSSTYKHIDHPTSYVSDISRICQKCRPPHACFSPHTHFLLAERVLPPIYIHLPMHTHTHTHTH